MIRAIYIRTSPKSVQFNGIITEKKVKLSYNFILCIDISCIKKERKSKKKKRRNYNQCA